MGISGTIAPTVVETDLLTRDMPVLAILTAALFIMAYSFRGPGTGQINKFEAGLLLVAYVAYNTSLAITAVSR